MVDYAGKKKTLHYVVWILFLVLGIAFFALAYADRQKGGDPAELQSNIFNLRLMVGVVLVSLAGLWRAVIRLSTEVAALEAKTSKTP